MRSGVTSIQLEISFGLSRSEARQTRQSLSTDPLIDHNLDLRRVLDNLDIGRKLDTYLWIRLNRKRCAQGRLLDADRVQRLRFHIRPCGRTVNIATYRLR